jgi:3-methyl-2-oxobutanoate hydroxymethyltransferase
VLILRITVNTLKEMKEKKERITMLTAYDYLTAKILDECGVEVLLVGDSLGMVVLGYENTLPVSFEDVLYHTKAVARGAKRAMVVADMPFLTYQVNREEALRNAGRYLKEGGAQGVKMEGGVEMAETIEKVVKTGIPVMGHIGLTPQSVHQLGGFKVQGSDLEKAKKLIEDAKALNEAGVFSIVLECVPFQLAQKITEIVSVPTIGIGAGPHCDGQVLVIHDLLGFSDRVPKFVKKYASFKGEMEKAVENYVAEVKEGKFPQREHSYSLKEEVLKAIIN